MGRTPRRAPRRSGVVVVVVLVMIAGAYGFMAGDDGPASAEVEATIVDFLAAPSGRTGEPVVEAMLAADDDRWVPWLIDLHRMTISSILTPMIAEGLAAHTGVPRPGNQRDDFAAYGAWAETHDIDPGPGYRQWKLALYGNLSDEFGELLSTVDDPLVLRDIHYGGVFRGGIPELNDPERVTVASADWMVPDEPVVAVEIAGLAVAYPVRILARNELANDVVGGVPLAMVYCTLCRTGLVFDRRITPHDGAELVLEFQTSGLLSKSNKIMVDNQTDTLWQHLSGTAFAGSLEGMVLTQLPAVTTTWGEFAAEHPDGETLAIPPPIFFPDIPDRPPLVYDYTPGTAYADYYGSDGLWFPAETAPGPLAPKAEVIGLLSGGEALAVPVTALVELRESIEVQVGGTAFTLVPTGAGAAVVDTDGEPVVAPQGFWFAWWGQHPDTAVWEP